MQFYGRLMRLRVKVIKNWPCEGKKAVSLSGKTTFARLDLMISSVELLNYSSDYDPE